MDETWSATGGEGSASAGAPGSWSDRTAEILLLSLAAGQLVRVPVAGAMATATDVLVAALVSIWLLELAAGRGWPRLLGEGRPRPPRDLPAPSFVLGMGTLLVFGIFMAASGLWGYHPAYALAKGAGAAGLALAAAAVGTGGLSWRRAVDAWLGGAAVALVLTVVLVLSGPAGREAVVYQDGGVSGLPFPRLTGPLAHPGALGDYLTVTGVLLWARWPSLAGAGKGWGALLAVGIFVALCLSPSSAWVGAGVVGAVAVLAGGWRPVRMAVAVGALALALVAGVAHVASLEVSVEGVRLVTRGLRPEIWAGALEAFETAPLVGVGAAPYLARVVDPVAVGAGPLLWDAHSLYLSVLGQLGLVGMSLFAAGVLLAASGGLRGRAPGRERLGMVLVLVGLGVNAAFTASEDLRHLWMALGLLGLTASPGVGYAAGRRPAGPSGDPGTGAGS